MHSTILAAGSSGAAIFWTTPIGLVIRTFLGAIGVMILVVAIMRSVTHVHQGKHGQALRLILGAAVLAAFCIDPTLINDLINAFTSVVSDVIKSISSLVGGSKGSSGTTGSSGSTATTIAGNGG